MRNAIALTIVLFIGSAAWAGDHKKDICHFGIDGYKTLNVGNPSSHLDNHEFDSDRVCTAAELAAGPGVVVFITEVFITEVSDLLVINSAAGKGSNSLTELVDDSDADAGAPLGLE